MVIAEQQKVSSHIPCFYQDIGQLHFVSQCLSNIIFPKCSSTSFMYDGLRAPRFWVSCKESHGGKIISRDWDYYRGLLNYGHCLASLHGRILFCLISFGAICITVKAAFVFGHCRRLEQVNWHVFLTFFSWQYFILLLLLFC